MKVITFMRFIIISFLIIFSYDKAPAQNIIDDVKTRTEQGEIALARGYIDGNIATALNLYKLDNDVFPSTAQGLKALLEKPTESPEPKEWNGPYLEKISLDPWGTQYGYQLLAEAGAENLGGYKLWSNGPNGIISQDDIIKVETGDPVLDENIQTKLKDLLEEAMAGVAKIKMTKVTINKNRKFSIEGEGATMSSVFDLVAALEDSALFERVRTEPTNAKSASAGEMPKTSFELSGMISVKVSNNNNFPEDLENLKNLFIKNNLYPAIANMEEKLTQDSRDFDYELNLLIARGEGTKAMERINQFIDTHPGERRGYARRAYMYLDKGLYEEAKSDFMKLLEICGEHNNALPFPFVHFAGLLSYLGDYKQAIDYYTKQIEWDLQHNQEQKKMAQEYPENFTRESKSLLEADPTIGYDFVWRGNAYRKAGQYDQALNDFSTASNYILNPRDYNYGQIYLLRAITYEAMGNREKVQESIDVLKSLKSDLVECDFDAWRLGCSQYKINEDDSIVLAQKLPNAIKPALKPRSIEERLSQKINLVPGGPDNMMAVSDILGFLALKGGLNLNVKGEMPIVKVNAYLKKVVLKDAIEQACQAAKLQCVVQGETLVVFQE